MFAYCLNNPLKYVDPSGTRSILKEDLISPEMLLLGVVAVSFVVLQSSQELLKEDTLAHTQILKKQRDYQYWEAYRVDNNVVVGRGITFIEASMRVSFGLNVICADQSAAKTLVIINGYWNAVGPEIHGDKGYYWHYHPNRYSHIHIWFY